MNTTEIPTDYRAVLERAAFYPQPETGVLRLGDQDRLDFLQRQTTNDLHGLRPDRSILTVLVSPTARILDVLRLVQDGDEILALTLPGHAAATFSYLQRRIFFNDRVRLADATLEFSQVDLEGPGLAEALQGLGFNGAPEMDEVVNAELQGSLLRAIGQRGLVGMGVRLLVPSGAAGGIYQALPANGAAKLSQESYKILRVETGLPAAPAELSEDYSPLEVGMEYAVSDSKGCYPGQEVIARQITYDKVTRKLVGLRLEAPAARGARLSAEGAPAGEITSAVISPRFGTIALGVVKRPHYDAGTTLEAAAKDQDQLLRAEVADLPFRE
jgi:folate-binding protein YgfZ